jgi:CheY-like chemotaxis protein
MDTSQTKQEISGYTVMVVEDEVLLLEAVTKKLKLEGMEVVSCISAEQALDILNNSERVPDAIWLDFYLKNMNGLAFMQKLKENSRFASIPVIVVSNSASPEKVQTMLTLGVKKYVLKAGNRLDELVKIVQGIIADAKKEEAKV